MSTPEKFKTIINKLNMEIDRHKTEFLLGIIDVDDSTYDELIDFTRALLNKEIILFKSDRYAIISLTLVLFAIRDYQNRQFWSEFATKINLDEREIGKMCKESFASFCELNGIYFHCGNVNKGYVTSILTHAIIPNSSLDKFIEFLQDIYIKDLEEDYIDSDVEELIQYMHRLFTRYLDDDDISLEFQGSKMTIARQQLPKAFRIAFVKSASIVTEIIERLLYYINQLNYGEIIEYLENDRFDNHFSQSSHITIDNKPQSTKTRYSRDLIKKFSIAQYHYEGRKLYLQIPKQIIDVEYIKDNIILEIYSNNEIIHREELLLAKRRLFFKTEQTTIQTKFYPKIAYKITSGNHEIYDSGKLLYRDYIMFDLNGNEVSPKRLNDETVKVITERDNEVLTDDALIDVVYESNYRISTVFMNEDSVLYINDKVLSSGTATIKNEIDTSCKYWGVVVQGEFSDCFDVYPKTPEIRLRIPYKKDIDDFIITINNCNFNLSDVTANETKTITDGSGDKLATIYIIETVLKKLEPTSITIREKGSNKTYLDENIFILESLNYEFDKDYYYNENEATLIHLSSHDIKFDNNLELPMIINIKKNKIIKVAFYVNDYKYKIFIEIPLLSWKFGNIYSEIKPSNYTWYEDIGEKKLFLNLPNKFINTKLYILKDEGHEKIEGKKISHTELRYTLDHLFLLIDQAPITLGIRLNGKEEIITEIHFKPTINNFSISYYNSNHLIQGLYASWQQIGKDELYMNIIYSPTQTIVKQYTLRNVENIMDRDISLFYNEHEAEIYQLIEDDFFGEGLEKKVLLREKFIVGDPVMVTCRNKLLKGIECICDSEKFQLSNFYLKDIRFSKKKGYYEATGMYILEDRYTGNKRECRFTGHNPFILKPISHQGDRIVFEIVDKDEDGLIYDLKSKFVNPEESNDVNRYRLIDEVVCEISKRSDQYGAESYKSIR